MNKLDPQHLHLLLDEPIYVLHEHFETPVKEPVIEHDEIESLPGSGANKKGIIIINLDEKHELISQEDEQFLFKGLNALDIYLDDVLIIPSGEMLDEVGHYNNVIRFTSNYDPGKLYKVTEQNETQHLECESLATIRPNIELQKKFWIALKTMFGRLG